MIPRGRNPVRSPGSSANRRFGRRRRREKERKRGRVTLIPSAFTRIPRRPTIVLNRVAVLNGRHSNMFRLFMLMTLFLTSLADEQNLVSFEDITMNTDDSMESIMEATSSLPPETESTPPNVTPAKSFSPVIAAEKVGELRFLPEEEQISSYPSQNKPEKSVFNTVNRDEDGGRQVVAGVPDMSDPCFRRYSNAIVVNAQPYERRSSTPLLKCKSHCLNSQSGVYSCRSFVFDNINQVCDLFAHVGDQAPARLLKFQTRDYFEPTSATQCLNVNGPDEKEIVARASSIDARVEEEEKVKVSEKDLLEQKTPPEEKIGDRCPAGKKPGFLRTQGFELFENDDVTMKSDDVTECVNMCKQNNIDGKPLNCRSFDRIDGSCHFSKEAAVPVGEGQLRQKEGSYYYERICVTEKMTRNCPISFNRFPQMILVGFAESVSDSPSFEHCFDSCLNSYDLFGFNCTSGMYYFEETQLNCILNTEDRHSQPDLFAEENTDIVDYFEISCERDTSKRRAAGVKTFKDSTIKSEKLVIAEETQTEWSECEEGVQHRRRDCGAGKECGMESRSCSSASNSSEVEKPEKRKISKFMGAEKIPSPKEVAMVKARLRKNGFHCPDDKCCKVFNGCAAGLMKNSKTGKLQWCRNPCEDLRKAKRRRLLKK